MIQAVIAGALLWAGVMFAFCMKNKKKADGEIKEKRKSKDSGDRMYVCAHNFVEKFKDIGAQKIAEDTIFIPKINYTIKIDASVQPCKCTILDEDGVKVFAGNASMCMIIIRNFVNKI